MRVLAMCIVFATLILGAGGVVSRPLAEPAGPEAVSPDPVSVESVQTELDEAVDERGRPEAPPRSCGAARPVAKPIHIDFSHVRPPKGFVSLNRTGYNYRTPGSPPQLIPDSTGAKQPQAVDE